MTGERGNCADCGTELTSENRAIYDYSVCSACERKKWQERHAEYVIKPNDEA